MTKTTEELNELKSYCKSVYKETLQLCEKNKDQGQIKGSWCLCGPPMIEPDVFFISYQGGGGDKTFHKTWPAQNFYYNSPYRLGQLLTSIFVNAGKREMLRLSTATALIFFQCSSVEHWKSMPIHIRNELEQFSYSHALSFIEKMRPKLVLAIGSDAFKALVKNPSLIIQPYRNKIVQEGTFANRRVLGISHLTGCRLKSDERNIIQLNIQRALNSIK